LRCSEINLAAGWRFGGFAGSARRRITGYTGKSLGTYECCPTYVRVKQVPYCRPVWPIRPLRQPHYVERRLASRSEVPGRQARAVGVVQRSLSAPVSPTNFISPINENNELSSLEGEHLPSPGPPLVAHPVVEPIITTDPEVSPCWRTTPENVETLRFPFWGLSITQGAPQRRPWSWYLSPSEG